MQKTPARRVVKTFAKLDTRDLSVFINCPYDKQYAPIFDCILFATVCCGFTPRCAIESGQISEPRIVKIVRLLKSCKYSIHDLCRCRGQGNQNLARFNMPLELGIAMSERFDESKPQNWHDWLVLVPPGHAYGAYISDLAGYDPKKVPQKVERVVPAVMSWLVTREEAIPCPPPKDVLAALPEFTQARMELSDRWCGDAPWELLSRRLSKSGRELN